MSRGPDTEIRVANFLDPAGLVLFPIELLQRSSRRPDPQDSEHPIASLSTFSLSRLLYAMSVNATSFSSPLANAKYAASGIPAQLEPVMEAISQMGIWTVALTILAVAVVYDQCMAKHPHS